MVSFLVGVVEPPVVVIMGRGPIRSEVLPGDSGVGVVGDEEIPNFVSILQ